MKRFTLLLTVMLLVAFDLASVRSEDTLDTLLPPPGWLRRRAVELDIEAQVRQRIEQMYKEKEPKYHQLKYKVERLAGALHTELVAEALDEERIVARMKALLEAENELKLYQVHVRVTLLAQVPAEQRRAARELAQQELADRKPWRGGLTAQVHRVQQLGKQLKESGGSIAVIEKRMSEIDKTVAAGKLWDAASMLEQVVRDLEESLNEKAGQD